MSSKIYKRCELMGDKMGNKRKMKRELEKKEARCMSIIIFRKGAKKKNWHYQRSKLKRTEIT